MRKLKWLKVISILIGILVGGLFLANLITTLLNWYVPLTLDQIDMIVYLLFVGWLGATAYYYVH